MHVWRMTRPAGGPRADHSEVAGNKLSDSSFPFDLPRSTSQPRSCVLMMESETTRSRQISAEMT